MLTRLASIGLLVLLAGLFSEAAAHEDAVLKSPVSAVGPGDVLPVEGDDFEENRTYTLRLVGALNEYDLGPVSAGPDGAFTVELQVPGNVRPGQYSVQAIAADGDVVASMDLTVMPMAMGAPMQEHMQEPGQCADLGGGQGQGVVGAEQAEDLLIQRPRSGAEWGLIGLIIGLAGGVGLTLLRRT